MRCSLWFVCLLCLASAGASCRDKSTEFADRCRGAHAEPLQREALQVYVDSTVQGDEIALGRIPPCGSHSTATEVYLLARDVLRTVPNELRPAQVTIHLSPKLVAGAAPILVSEVHTPSASILINGQDLDRLDASTLLHEFGHLQWRSPHPRGLIASRIMASLEEGIADYYAATTQGSAKLGFSGGQAARDLLQRPVWLRGGWTRLSRETEVWRAHEQGWDWAALLWSHEQKPGVLLFDLLVCMRNARIEASTSPAQVIRAWLETCPARSQDTIDALLHRWIPRTLY